MSPAEFERRLETLREVRKVGQVCQDAMTHIIAEASIRAPSDATIRCALEDPEGRPVGVGDISLGFDVRATMWLEDDSGDMVDWVELPVWLADRAGSGRVNPMTSQQVCDHFIHALELLVQMANSQEK